MNSTNIKQNKNYSAMIYSAMIILVIAVFFIFSFPVFADSPYYGSFSSQPLNVYGTSSYLPVFEGSRGVYYASSSNDHTYLFLVSSSETSRSGQTVFVSSDNFTWYWSLSSDGSSVESYNSSFNSTYNCYVSSRNYSSVTTNFGVPMFTSFDDGMAYVVDSFLNSDSSGVASLISTSFLPVSSTSYIKSTRSGCAGYAYYYDGTYYNLVVGNINSTAFVNIANDTSQHPVNLPSQLTFDDTPIYYNPNAMRVSESDTSELGYFTNLNAAVEAIYDVLDVSTSEPSQNLAHPLNLSLQPGNVAFIDITGLSEQYFTIKCNLSGLAYYTLADFNAKMNYMIGYADSLPASFSLPIEGTSKINWTVERGVKPTVTGTYNQFYYSDLYSFSSGKYLVVVNPVYENIDINSVTVMDINAYNVNNILNISMEANDYYVYSLSVSVGYQDGQSTYETGSSTTQYAGTYDPSTESWQTVNTATNEPESPAYGGDVQQPTYTPEQESKRFVTWLQDFLKGFVSIFDAGKTAIMTLVGYASGFFAVIGSLYAWLPPPVYSVLISGIILVITIGIIKAFI